MPQRTLYAGATMLAIGLGTYGSDHAAPSEIAGAVRGATEVGYWHIDCAAIYGNEADMRLVLQEALACGLSREDLGITSKLWNDKHRPEDARPTCRQSLADLRLDYLDLYLVHYPRRRTQRQVVRRRLLTMQEDTSYGYRVPDAGGSV